MDKAPTRVLLVTNDVENRAQIHRLADDNYRLIDATSGLEGFEFFDTEPVDCILLDCDLHDIDGLDCLARFMHGPRDIAIIVISGRGDERIAVKAMKQGALDYLVKGNISREELYGAIDDAIAGVTTRRDQKQQQQELEQFVSTAAHDLKAPLHNIYYMIETTKLTELEKLDDSTLDCLDRVSRQTNRLAELVDNLLDYSRTGQEQRPLEAVDLTAVMEQALTHLAATVREQGARFQIDPLPVVQGDRVSLVQLFQNLIGNALKFHGEDPPVVQVSAVPTDETWSISVRDNGIGIDPAFHKEIFAPLRRLNKPGRYEGHGLGLAICRKIIDRHRGRIWIDSAPGQGTTFSFTLPGAGQKPAQYRVP